MTPAPLYLHGFGPSLNVPVSQALTFYAAVGVVLLSFVLLVAFTGGTGTLAPPRFPIWRVAAAGRLIGSGAIRAAGSTAGLLLLAATLVCAWLGSADALSNPAEYVVWIYFWVGLLLLTAVVGDVWALISPFPALYRLLSPRDRPGIWRLPDWLGAWPAVVFFFAWAWFELASGVSDRPRTLAIALIAYTALTAAGMRAFGREEWLRRGEAFTVLLSIVGRFGVLGLERPAGRKPVLAVRPWAVGLLGRAGQSWDAAALVVVAIGTLAFDSFSGTAPWVRLEAMAAPALTGLDPAAEGVVLRSAGLLLTVLLFVLVFLVMIRLVLHLGSQTEHRAAAAAGFAYALVPIFIGYDAAHYLTYLLLQGPALWRLLPDLLSRGPVAPFHPGTIDPSTLWRLQIGLVVVGHVIAVALGHLRAREVFRTPERVLASQYPTLIMMVTFTAASLWLLSGGAPP
ncbi:MAG TPA: hypothetical protein VIA06_23590 [Candidatus Dormibacteraeota bacterium]|nr:hypothetical protein [Candidatus Dormibacteraeota bacterium]